MIPEKYAKYNLSPIDEFFAMGRGLQKPSKDGEAAVDVPSLVRFNSDPSHSPWLITDTFVGDGEMV